MKYHKIHLAKTIPEIIERGREDPYILDNTHIFNSNEYYTMATSNVFLYQYRDIIEKYLVRISLDKAMQKKYFYRPKTLSLDLYEMVDLWYLLLFVNRISDVMSFNQIDINVYDPDKLDVLNKILNREKTNLLENKRNPPKMIKYVEKWRR